MNENFDGRIIKWFSLLEVPTRGRPVHNSGHGSRVNTRVHKGCHVQVTQQKNRLHGRERKRESWFPSKNKEEENELEGERSRVAAAARGESVFSPSLGLQESPGSSAVHHPRRRLVNSIKLWAGMCEYFDSFHLLRPRTRNSIRFSHANELMSWVAEMRLEKRIELLSAEIR